MISGTLRGDEKGDEKGDVSPRHPPIVSRSVQAIKD